MGRQTKTADVLGTGQRWGGGPAYGPMLAEDRVAVFALDCPQALEWRNWRPGNEYEKMLVMKNVGTKALRIKYQLPASKYFSMEFPEPAKIGAGLSWAVKVPPSPCDPLGPSLSGGESLGDGWGRQEGRGREADGEERRGSNTQPPAGPTCDPLPPQVVFRPVKLQMYEDELTFLMPNGSFVVPLIGRTPVLGIQVLPSEVQFGYMAVKESGDRTFEVQNTGDLPVLFKWRVEEPFSITPSRGQIPQGSLAQFAVSFAPKEASVFTANVRPLPPLPRPAALHRALA